MDLGPCTIEVPENWVIDETMVAPQTMMIRLDDRDTLIAKWGTEARSALDHLSLEVTDVTITESYSEDDESGESHLIGTEKQSSTEIVQSEQQPLIIDGLKAAILIPEAGDRGVTGVFFSRLNASFPPDFGFNLFGINLKAENATSLRAAFPSLKFKTQT